MFDLLPFTPSLPWARVPGGLWVLGFGVLGDDDLDMFSFSFCYSHMLCLGLGSRFACHPKCGKGNALNSPPSTHTPPPGKLSQFFLSWPFESGGPLLILSRYTTF